MKLTDRGSRSAKAEPSRPVGTVSLYEPGEEVTEINCDLLEEADLSAPVLSSGGFPHAVPPSAAPPERVEPERKRQRTPTLTSPISELLAKSTVARRDARPPRVPAVPAPRADSEIAERIADGLSKPVVHEAGPDYVVEVIAPLASPVVEALAEDLERTDEVPVSPELVAMARGLGVPESLAKRAPRALRTLPHLDLRGVFRLDGTLLAALLSLPERLFASAPASLFLGGTTGVPEVDSATHPSLSSSARPTDGESASKARHTERGHKNSTVTLPRGAIVDKYRIDRLLGKGGFAVVYRATHLLLNTQVAIKMLRPEVVARHPHFAKLLYAEARFAARIDHPNVVRVYDVTHTPSITYIVMEYIDGRSLAETLAREHALPLARVLEIGAKVVEGLKVALAAGLIHRDIKPANVLLGRRGEIKIVDLGLVRRASAPSPEYRDPEAAPGRRSVIGTYGYMAPEQQVDPDRVDFRTDIYALGATLYEAALGGPPFPLADPIRCGEMHSHSPVPLPETRAPSFPSGLSKVLLRMLAKNPDDRFASYDELSAALDAAAAALVH